MSVIRMTTLRKRKGLRQLDVARATGLTEQIVSRIETGRRAATREEAQRIAQVLEAPTFELFTEVNR